jgi:hypothetical protein
VGFSLHSSGNCNTGDHRSPRACRKSRHATKNLAEDNIFCQCFYREQSADFSCKGLKSPLKSALSEGQCDSPSYFVRGTFFPEPFAIMRNFRFIDSLTTRLIVGSFRYKYKLLFLYALTYTYCLCTFCAIIWRSVICPKL